MCVVAQDRRSGRASVVVVAESGDVEGGGSEGERRLRGRSQVREGSRVGLFVQTRGAGAYRRWEVLGRALGTSWWWWKLS